MPSGGRAPPAGGAGLNRYLTGPALVKHAGRVSVRAPTRRTTRWARSLGVLFIVVAAIGTSACSSSSKPQVTVAAAADLRFAFEEIAAAFEGRCGCDVVLTFGSSGISAIAVAPASGGPSSAVRLRR